MWDRFKEYIQRLSLTLKILLGLLVSYAVGVMIFLVITGLMANSLYTALQNCVNGTNTEHCEAANKADINFTLYAGEGAYFREINTALIQKLERLDGVGLFFSALPEALLSPGQAITLEVINTITNRYKANQSTITKLNKEK